MINSSCSVGGDAYKFWREWGSVVVEKCEWQRRTGRGRGHREAPTTPNAGDRRNNAAAAAAATATDLQPRPPAEPGRAAETAVPNGQRGWDPTAPVLVCQGQVQLHRTVAQQPSGSVQRQWQDPQRGIFGQSHPRYTSVMRNLLLWSERRKITYCWFYF